MSIDGLYAGREQTLVKHLILQKYLERFAHIVGSRWNVLTYVDCFSGPWNARSEEFEDSSFAIALKELRKARETHARDGRPVKLRCFFLEKSRAAHAKLKEFADRITDVQIETRNAALEESVPEILDFVRRGGASAFPFVFIDPTGWTGFAMETITPLLQLNPGEVLINFMTGHIRRFLESPQAETQASFRRLFGSEAFSTNQGLALHDREDAAVEEYARNVKKIGGFAYTCTAIVLHPEIDRTHFNLIYATRSPKGIEVFKEAERKAMAVQEAVRAEAHRRRREARTGQLDLLSSQELHDPSLYNSLRDRYLNKSQSILLQALKRRRPVLYDDAWVLALSQPMTWERDLKAWIEEWIRSGRLEITGMEAGQRAPRRNANNCLVWI
ncbi:MAG: three-Cys-motif partner protein TcmP [Verrucomicrobiota bacterium]|jgi:three-Cys-motif partner protein